MSFSKKAGLFVFTLALFIFSGSGLASAYTAGSSFSVTASGLSGINVGKTFSQNAEVYSFSSSDPIFRLAVSGEVNLNSEKALVRIVLVDQNSKEYLIYEAYPLTAEGRRFSIADNCEETCVLGGVSPKMVKVFLVDASVKITKLSYSSRAIVGAPSQSSVKESQQQEKIRLLNEKIQQQGLRWVAGDTVVSRLSYEEKKNLFDGRQIPNLNGFEYYKGGIFEVTPAPGGNFGAGAAVQSFDWRNRHGQNWLTPVRDQGDCGSCWAFSAVGIIEGLVNIYYNQHLNLDLSEQEVSSCTVYEPIPGLPDIGGCLGGDPGEGLRYIMDHGNVNESCFPYRATDLPCSSKCLSPSERVKFRDYWQLMLGLDEETLKKNLIENGPISLLVFPWTEPGQAPAGHAVVLTGYEDYGGEATLIIKNSWGTAWGEGGYGRIRNSAYPVEGYYYMPNFTPLTLGSYQQKCEDRDSDGYCNWGFPKSAKPSNCPASCKAEIDCDDSDASKASFDDSYQCASGSGPTPNPPGVNWNCADSSYQGRQYWTCSGGNIYRCENNVPQMQTCANGCVSAAAGQDDYCRDTPNPNPDPNPPSGNCCANNSCCNAAYLGQFWNRTNMGSYYYSQAPQDAAKVCQMESGGKCDAVANTAYEYSVGLFQINTRVHNYDPNRLKDPVYNNNAAITIFKNRASYLMGPNVRPTPKYPVVPCTSVLCGWDPWTAADPEYLNIFRCHGGPEPDPDPVPPPPPPPPPPSVLSVNLSAEPGRGDAPLRDVDLTATVSNAQGSINYKFECGNGGSWDFTIDTTQTTYRAQDLCDYTTDGYYTTKVQVSSGGSTAEDVAVVEVTRPSIQVDLKANNQDEATVAKDTAFTLSWTSFGARSCKVPDGSIFPDWQGDKGTSGSQNMPGLSATRTYNITCQGDWGVGSASDFAIVNVSEAGEPASADIKANGSDDTITIDKGASVTISWSSQNADTCEAFGHNDFTGSIPISGTRQIANLQTTTGFSIYCFGPGGRASDAVLVNVRGSVPSLPEVNIKANGQDNEITIQSGSSVDLSWTSANVASCTATGHPSWQETKPVSGTQQITNITAQTTFVLNCVGNDGGSVSDSVTVNIQGTPPPPPPPSDGTVTLKANGKEDLILVKKGDNITLSWTSTNVASCTASGHPSWQGSKSVSGTKQVTITEATTFVLDCIGNDGGAASDFVTVNMEHTPSDPSDINVFLGASLIEGNVPLTVDFTAKVFTTGLGTINYKFECGNGGGWDYEKTTSDLEVYADNLCTYTKSGTYVAKVYVTAQGKSGVATNSITVRETNIHLSAEPSSGWAPLEGVNFTALTNLVLWENSNKSFYYYFYCNSADERFGRAVNGKTRSTITVVDACRYPQPGAYTAKVKVAIIDNATGQPEGPEWSTTTGIIVYPLAFLKVNGSSGPVVIDFGSSVTLEWNYSYDFYGNREVICYGAGHSQWEKEITSRSGTQQITNITEDTNFSLTCTDSLGYSHATSVAVKIRPSAGPVSADIKANNSNGPITVDKGASVNISWTSENASTCQASGHSSFSGAKSASGNQQISNIQANTTFSISCSGSEGSGFDSVKVNVTETVPLVDIKVNGSNQPKTIDYGGDVEVSWSSTNAIQCDGFISGKPVEENIGLSGRRTFRNIRWDTTFFVTCKNQENQWAEDSVKVSVASTVEVKAEPSSGQAPLSVRLTATALSRTFSGNTMTYYFDCQSDGIWDHTRQFGSFAVLSYTMPSPCVYSQPGNYKVTVEIVTAEPTHITATWGGFANIEVLGASVLPTVSLKANGQDEMAIDSGGSAYFNWWVENADSCRASSNPSHSEWQGTKTVPASGIPGQQQVSGIQQTTTFELSCTGRGGTVSDTVRVNVEAPAKPVLVDIKANGSDSTITIDKGASVNISWSSQNADTCEASGNDSFIGSIPLSDTRQILNLQMLAGFSVFCYGPGGIGSDSVVVNVREPVQPLPEANIKANGRDAAITIDYNTSANLTWTSVNAQSCEAFGAWSGDKPLSGSQSTGNLTSEKEFGIKCLNARGVAFDTVKVSVLPQQDLEVLLEADPSSGVAPLNGVDLSAVVYGSAEGNITYKFDCTGDGTWEKTAFSLFTNFSAVDLCSYQNHGTYRAKVQAERGGVIAEDYADITVRQGDAPVCSPLNYPRNNWQRVWYDWDGVCLGDGPDEKGDLDGNFSNNWQEGVLAYGLADRIQFTSSNKIYFPRVGTYKFRLSADEGATLYINNVKEMSIAPQDADKDIEKDIEIKQNYLNFRIDYFENSGPARLSFNYELVTSTEECPICEVEEKCVGKVIKTCKASDASVNVRDLPTHYAWCSENIHDACPVVTGTPWIRGEVNPYYWDGESCEPDSSGDKSVLYGEKQVVVDDISKYSIQAKVKADDNCKVFINGNEVGELTLNRIGETSFANITKYFKNGANEVKFVAEDLCSEQRYFDIQWKVEDVSGQCDSMKYPSNVWQRVWYDLEGNCLGNGPDEPNLNFSNSWQSGELAHGRKDGLKMISSRKVVTQKDGKFVSYVTADEGMRLYVDDKLKIDAWSAPVNNQRFVYSFPAGEHNFRIEYFENAGLASLSFNFMPIEEDILTCEVEGERRNGVTRTCTSQDLQGSIIDLPRDDNWCVYNLHDQCIVGSGIYWVDGEMNPNYWEEESCEEDSSGSESTLIGEKEVFLEYMYDYVIKAKVHADDVAWVTINNTVVEELTTRCCGPTEWVDVTEYFNYGNNKVAFEAKDYCSGNRYFDLNWEITFIPKCEEGECMVDGACRTEAPSNCFGDDVAADNISNFLSDKRWCMANIHDYCHVYSGIQLLDNLRNPSFWEPESCEEDSSGHNSELVGYKAVNLGEAFKDEGMRIKARTYAKDRARLWVNGYEVPSLTIENSTEWTNWVDVTSYFSSGGNEIRFSADDLCARGEWTEGDRWFDVQWEFTTATSSLPADAYPKGDLNRDNLVNERDLALFLEYPYIEGADLNEDGVVNSFDYWELVALVNQ